jgi:hypothetical protein
LEGLIFIARPQVSNKTICVSSLLKSFLGVTDHYALNDEHALTIGRKIIRHLNKKKDIQVNWMESCLLYFSMVIMQLQLETPSDPLYCASELGGIVGTLRFFGATNTFNLIIEKVTT